PRTAPARIGASLAARGRWDVSAHDPSGSERPRADLHRHLGGGRVPERRRRQDVAADEPRPQVRADPRPDGRGRPLRSPHRDALTKGLPQRDCYVNVLRDAMAVDALDPCGVYFGTSGGQVYVSADSGDSWKAIVRDLPSVVSVEVQTLP